MRKRVGNRTMPATYDWCPTSDDLFKALKRKHTGGPGEWLFFGELQPFTGGGSNRFDAWALNCWNSRLKAIAYEIKVTRQDYKHELKNPVKRRNAMRFSNEFWFVIPDKKELIWYVEEELPWGCGLMVFTESERLKIIVKAPTRKIEHPPWGFVAALARRASGWAGW